MVVGGNTGTSETLAIPRQTLGIGEGVLILRLNLPDGYKINPQAPSFARFRGYNANIAFIAAPEIPLTSLETRIALQFSPGQTALTGEIDVFYCEATNETLCFIDTFTLQMLFEFSENAETREVVVERTIVPPAVRTP